MEIQRLFTMQRMLDERIAHEHNLIGKNLINEKIVALQVELGELANETRCFKFWSVKPPAAPQIILEEYVDGLHFILSIGNDLKLQFTTSPTITETECTIVEQFLTVYEHIHTFWKVQTFENYEQLFCSYLYLGQLLGFSKQDIESAYDKKNKVNHVRQIKAIKSVSLEIQNPVSIGLWISLPSSVNADKIFVKISGYFSVN